ncbi:MAG: lysophospholipid acyltransferase family protein [Thermodesulfobacteriota bacterium]
MIDTILYRCPACGGFKWLAQGRCRHCHVSVRMLSRKQVAVNGKAGSIALWYGKVKGHALPEGSGGMILKSGPIRLSRETQNGRFKGLSGVHAILHGREPAGTGSLDLYRERLFFQGASLNKSIPFESISAVTIESNTVIVDRNNGRTLYFDFLEESGKQWEDCIQKAMAEFFSPEDIVEFCPKIRFVESRGSATNKRGQFHEIHVAVEQWYKSDLPQISLFLKHFVGSLVRGLLDFRMTGMENIPRQGAAILAANHVSLLDGIILGACLPRLARFMTKNSQFNHPVIRTILRLGGAFPVRRYHTDVVAVRNALRVLQNEHLLGVFPEGERSWDGRMLPFKKGTLRLMLAAGKPVIPVGISGIYELMPRWTHKIKRVPVRVNVGKPMRFASISIVDQTDEDVKLVDRQLRSVIQGLIA